MDLNTLTRLLPEIALAAALAWGSGLRLYAVLFLTGLAGTMGWVELPAHLTPLSHPAVLGASGFMSLVELGADKLPWLDSVWDAAHTFIRIPAGAALAAAVFGADGATMAVLAGILGGTLTAGTHLAKAGTRATANASPEPFSNWGLSVSEDAIVPAGLWLAVAHPLAFMAALAVMGVAMVLLLRSIVRGLRSVLQRLQGA